MLERLTVRDFALARDVTLAPGPGLNVFTGETGAGKSLVAGAIAFIAGARRGREVIAVGAERAEVEATLVTDGGRTIVWRAIGLSGRSTARINDEPASVEQLRALAGPLLDVHGQSEQLSLLRPTAQLAALDTYAGLDEQREALAVQVRALRQVRRRLAALEADVRERDRLVDQLRFEASEIEAATLTTGEDQQLRAEAGRLGSIERLLAESSRAADALDAAAISEVAAALNAIVALDPSAAPLADLAVILESSAADLQRDLRRYRDGLEADPDRLTQVQERLDRIARLRRKYGDTVEDILAYAVGARERLAALVEGEASLAALQAQNADLLAKLAPAAQALSQARRAAAAGLVDAIGGELETLAMGRAALAVAFSAEDEHDHDPESGLSVAVPDYEVVPTQQPQPPAHLDTPHPRAFTETGVDRVELLAAFNSGEPPRPLAQVASGGETSRFLLALTAVLGAAAAPRLIVLDEVDEGVGGRAGALVGAALARLARRHQVLCITHLPQVAACGERHFVVSKDGDGARSWSSVREVSGEERVHELAAMLGGATSANLEAARELLQLAPAAP